MGGEGDGIAGRERVLGGFWREWELGLNEV